MAEQNLPQMPLGQPTEYDQQYSPDILVAVPREMQRRTLSHVAPYGFDIWNAYELSWLTETGVPVVRLARFTFPADSKCLVESKSLKLYLNAFNMERFPSETAVRELICKDLSNVVEAPVDVQFFNITDAAFTTIDYPAGQCIDNVQTVCSDYTYRPDILCTSTRGPRTEETVHSHLLRSNCLVTGQPDWGSIEIAYRGRQLDHATLLRYLVSFRQHREFHEHCVERVFADIWSLGDIEKLVVRAQYTRRGGLDINPVRSSHPLAVQFTRWTRQ